jgi:hypothetical protein
VELMAAYLIDEARENVERGGVFLDENYPGWVWRTTPDFLMMQDGCGCVLAQVGRTMNYAEEIERIWPDVGDEVRDRLAHDRGFVVGAHLAEGYAYLDDDEGAAWRMLDALWRDLIERRRAADTGVQDGGER